MSALSAFLKSPLIKKYFNLAIQSGIPPILAANFIQDQLTSAQSEMDKEKIRRSASARPDEEASLVKGERTERIPRAIAGLAGAAAGLALPKGLGKLVQLFGLGGGGGQQTGSGQGGPQAPGSGGGPQQQLAQLAQQMQGQQQQQQGGQLQQQQSAGSPFQNVVQQGVQAQQAGSVLPMTFHKQHPRVADFMEKLFQGGLPFQQVVGMAKNAKRFQKEVTDVEELAQLPFEQVIQQLIGRQSPAQGQGIPQQEPQQQGGSNLQQLQELIKLYQQRKGIGG